MRSQRRYLPPATAAVLACGALLSGCSSSPPRPQTTANAYLAAWAKQDWTAMRQLTSAPPAGFTPVNQAAFRNLTVRQASITAGTMHTGNSAASAPITERLTLAGLGTITIKSELHLILAQGRWRVEWSPATITPQLRAGDQLSLQTTWPARAAILGAHGTPLTSQGQVVTIGVEGARIKNAAMLKSALVAAGAPAAAASAAITAARTHPTYFEPVFTVPRARYNELEQTIYPIPGTVFQSSTARSALTPGLTAGAVGTVGLVTAQELSKLGAPYTAQNSVGQAGLEQADERQLAGTPGATVSVVSASGQAIDGGFPPGSTFKVITSTALISHGLTPHSTASCPGTATIDGEVFHNAESEAPVSNLLQAFTESCNTAFIRLATGHLSPSDFPATAEMFGLGHRPHIGLVAFGGSVPQPKDAADLAATSIGQGRVLVSPLKTDAWLMGFRGDIAFAALVVNSAGNGGPTCGPIVAKFLNGL